VLLLLFFAVMILYVAEREEVSGHEPPADLQARLETATERNMQLDKQRDAMARLVDELQIMVGAKVPSREGFQEAVETLKRGYALCQKDDNTLIEARIQNGDETVHVLGEIPSDLTVNLAKGDHTSDLEHIVSFLQDVYDYEKDHKCRFNYRLKYATDNDYRKGRDGYEKYFYPEKITRLE
jgi:hypothetical protein